MSDDSNSKRDLPAVAIAPSQLPRTYFSYRSTQGGVVLVLVGLFVAAAPAITLWLGAALLALSAVRTVALWVRRTPDPADAAPDSDPAHARVKAEIRKLRVTDGIETQGEALYDLLDHARQVKKQFDAVLARRLAPGEVTFSRFEQPFHDLYSSILARISATGVDLKTWATVRDPAAKQAMEKQWQDARAALTTALGEMEKIVVALGQMKTGEGTSAESMTESLARLQAIASRVERFSKPDAV